MHKTAPLILQSEVSTVVVPSNVFITAAHPLAQHVLRLALRLTTLMFSTESTVKLARSAPWRHSCLIRSSHFGNDPVQSNGSHNEWQHTPELMAPSTCAVGADGIKLRGYPLHKTRTPQW